MERAAAAIALTVAEDLLSSQTERWLGAVGLIYIVVALLPSGKDQMAAVRQAVQRTRVRPQPQPSRAEEKV